MNKFAITFAASALTLAAAAALPDAAAVALPGTASQAAATSPGAVCPTSYTGTKYGASVNDDADWQRLSGMLGRNMCAARIFYSHALAVSGDPKVASLPTNATVVFSWKDTMTASAVTSALNSRPAGMVCYAAYYHEPEDNFTTAAQQTAYRASWATYGPAIGAAGCTPILILMRYTLSSASGRNWHAWSNPGAYDVNGWDAYNPAWNDNPSGYIDPAKLLGPIQRVAAETGKPFALTETGSPIAVMSTSAARAAWVSQLAPALQNAGAKLALWWDVANSSFDNAMDQAAADNWNRRGHP